MKNRAMGSRGVVRPISGMKMQGDSHDQGEPNSAHQQSEQNGPHHAMSKEQRQQMLHMHHMQTLWIYWTIIVLGAWMVMSPCN